MERLRKISSIIPKHSSDIGFSQLGIGFEKLDRNVFDPEKAYDLVAAIGVKWVRIQSGWARTEKSKGIYDFTWIDSIVDNLIRRGTVPWICLCYGNEIYTEAAKSVFGAVGCPPIHTGDERAAWRNYVRILTEHFRGRVSYYEVWNEPDGLHCWKHGVNAREYGLFVAATAAAAKEGDPECKIIGAATCSVNLPYLSEAMAAGMGENVDAISFHRYNIDESVVQSEAAALRALCDQYSRRIEIIQGESGSPSDSRGAGALCKGAWTQKKQAKYLLRHRMIDFACGFKFTSHFTSVDMIEALNGVVGDKKSYLDYGYFGVISADFDDEGKSTGEYTPKPSYFAFQNLCSVFAEEVKAVNLPIRYTRLASERLLSYDYDGKSMLSVGFSKPNGSYAFAYWHCADLLTTDFESTVSLIAAGLPGPVRLVDLMDGAVYDLPQGMLTDNGSSGFLLKNIPIRDYPLLLTFGDFV